MGHCIYNLELMNGGRNVRAILSPAELVVRIKNISYRVSCFYSQSSECFKQQTIARQNITNIITIEISNVFIFIEPMVANLTYYFHFFSPCWLFP